MTVYGNYDVIAFKSCVQIFTVESKCNFIKVYPHFAIPSFAFLFRLYSAELVRVVGKLGHLVVRKMPLPPSALPYM